MSALETPQRTTNEAVTSNPNLLPFIVWTHLLSGILGLSFHLQENKTLRSRQRGSDQTESAIHRATTNRASARESREKDALRPRAGVPYGISGPVAAGCSGVPRGDEPIRVLRVSYATQPDPPLPGGTAAAEQHALHAPCRWRVQHFLALVHSDYLRIFTLAHGI